MPSGSWTDAGSSESADGSSGPVSWPLLHPVCEQRVFLHFWSLASLIMVVCPWDIVIKVTLRWRQPSRKWEHPGHC